MNRTTLVPPTLCRSAETPHSKPPARASSAASVTAKAEAATAANLVPVIWQALPEGAPEEAARLARDILVTDLT
jgi:hypothetical protein